MLSAICGPFFSTRGGPFSLLLPPLCPPALTASGESPRAGLLEGSCGRCRRRVMRNRVYVGTYVRMHHQLLNMKRSSEGGVGKTSIVHTITDTIMIVMYLLFVHDGYLQNAHRKVQCRQFSTHVYSLCVPGLLVATSISRIA